MWGARPYFVNIQILRALAAGMVVLYHLGTEVKTATGLAPPLGFGVVGVDLFFVISGFVMALTADGEPSVRRFALKRLVRIVPLYWLATLAIFGVALVLPDVLGDTRADFGHLLKSLFFIAYERPSGRVEPLLFLGWTLNYEMAFYALVAVSLTAGRLAPLVVLSAIGGAIAYGALADPLDRIARFYTEPIIGTFAFGYAFYYAYRRFGVPRGVAALLMTGGLVLLILWDRWPAGGWDLATRGVPALMVLAGAVALPPWPGRSGEALAAIGAASYALYLLHPYVLRPLAIGAAHLGGPPLAIAAGLMASGVLACVAVAILAYRRVEKPLTARLRKAARV